MDENEFLPDGTPPEAETLARAVAEVIITQAGSGEDDDWTMLAFTCRFRRKGTLVEFEDFQMSTPDYA